MSPSLVSELMTWVVRWYRADQGGPRADVIEAEHELRRLARELLRPRNQG